MDHLDGVSVFVTVAECGSFSAAASKLGLSKSTVSEQITRLEARIGARLLNRSTRAVTLTEAGRVYLCQIDDLLDRVQRAEKAAQAEAHEPRGPLRISVPAPFASTHIAPHLPEFMARNPEIKLELQVTSEVVDLIASGFDLAIRLCANNNPNSIVRTLGGTRMILVAAPAILRQRGVPAAPSDLEGWPGLVNTAYPDAEVWPLQRGDQAHRIRFKAVFVANSIDLLREMALAGAGVTLIGEYAVLDDLEGGRLVRLLPDWNIFDVPVLAVYPHNRRISAKVKAFVEFLAKKLQNTRLST